MSVAFPLTFYVDGLKNIYKYSGTGLFIVYFAFEKKEQLQKAKEKVSLLFNKKIPLHDVCLFPKKIDTPNLILAPYCSIPKNTCSFGISVRLMGDTALWSSEELRLIKLIAGCMPFGKEKKLPIQPIPRETLIYKW